MGENSAIEWTDHTFNPWSGCTKVSPGCANCYAESMAQRFPALGNWGPGAERKRTSAANWRKPLAWDRNAAGQLREWECADLSCMNPHGSPRRPRVFCASLADWLDPEVPAEWLADLLALIAQTPHLDWLLLTKRPELWADRVGEAQAAALDGPGELLAATWQVDGEAPPNVWVGTSVEDQRRAEERMGRLAGIPARVRFLSCEPLIGPVDLGLVEGDEFHWVIAGGESGPGARPMHPDWARSLRDQCQAAGVPFFFKQWGAWVGGTYSVEHPTPSAADVGGASAVHGWGGGVFSSRVGKKAAGRLLDGRTWDEVPSS